MNTKPGAGGWKPDAHMLQWTRSLIAAMNDGGTWAVPANGNVYVFDKKAKVLKLVAGNPDHELHRRTVVAFGALGWTVQDSRDNANGSADELDLAESSPSRRQLGTQANRGAQAALLRRRF